jgi:hypothetical protein
MRTEIPQDRQTGRLARGHVIRGRMGEYAWEYGGPVDRQTDRGTGQADVRLGAM